MLVGPLLPTLGGEGGGMLEPAVPDVLDWVGFAGFAAAGAACVELSASKSNLNSEKFKIFMIVIVFVQLFICENGDTWPPFQIIS